MAPSHLAPEQPRQRVRPSRSEESARLSLIKPLRICDLNTSARALLRQSLAGRGFSRDTSANKAYLVVWKSARRAPTRRGGRKARKVAKRPVRWKVLSEAKAADRCARRVSAPFLLRRECEELRRCLEVSTHHEQGLSAQIRAQHVLRQSRDTKCADLLLPFACSCRDERSCVR